MEKIDLKKTLKHLYSPSAKQVEIVDVPPLQYVMLDGIIEPGHSPGTSPGFEAAFAGLYGISYTLKFMLKKRPHEPVDYGVMGMEGLWWVEDGHFDITQPGNWHYTLMILQPDFITPALFEEALAQLRKKKPGPALDRLYFTTFHEGCCVQMMHLGPYADEMATIEKLVAFAAQNGYQMHGKHHEIYLGDPRRTDPAKLKTILRHQVLR